MEGLFFVAAFLGTFWWICRYATKDIRNRRSGLGRSGFSRESDTGYDYISMSGWVGSSFDSGSSGCDSYHGGGDC